MQTAKGVTITVDDTINCIGRNLPNCDGCMSSANSKILRYQELAERLAELIRHGTYPSDGRIPSVRQMSSTTEPKY